MGNQASTRAQNFSTPFDEFWAALQNAGGKVSAEEFRTMLSEMMTKKKEAEEKARKDRRAAKQKTAKKTTEKKSEQKNSEEEAHIAAVTSMELPLDWENTFATDPRAAGVHTESIPDALVLSLTTLGRVDIEYIASITGEDLKNVISALRGSIYQNPESWDECFFRGWETAEEYLSGNLFRKLQVAKEANKKYNGYFRENVDALKRLLPPPADAAEIYVTLGSPWVPSDVIDDFITHILSPMKGKYSGTKHDEKSGSWEIPNKGLYYNKNALASAHTYGTRRMDALTIVEKTLNMKSATVYDEDVVFVDGKRKTRRVINKQETTLALEKQQKLIEEFRRFATLDERRCERLTTIFTERYGYMRRRIYDGSFLTFPTMSKDVTLFPYQKNAVARILFSPNTLLAHDVGSGKTFIMIAAGMELRRMGLSKKNLYVVPNSVLGQWKAIFKHLYPDAKVLTVSPSSFTPAHRATTLERIRDEDFDAILMAYSCFEGIPISREYYENILHERAEELADIAKHPSKATGKVERQRTAVHKKIADLMKADVLFNYAVTFDELGITRLFVDEAHNYKNVEIDTQSDRVLGISPGGSKKCRDMMDKVHIVQRMNGGGGVVMATGTPITNSITDIFVMQQYLQSGELALLDLSSFDSWIGMFAERVTEFEIDVDTSSYRMATRFSKFHNLPELTSLLSNIADFHRVDPSAGIPEFYGYSNVLLPRDDGLDKFLKNISERADKVRAGKARAKEDNMLKITTDGRKAALDLRLVVGKRQVPHDYVSKSVRCAENAAEIYFDTMGRRATQLIFCDSSTPKADFNIYDEVKNELCRLGVKPEEIAYIHEAESERRRAELFERTRRGDIRILIGSTFKLGIGVNVQDKLYAIHHLDVPWRPSDMTQREGRILRQGNENREVKIFRYITEGSFDAYSWQLLETKQRFITGLLSGSMAERTGDEVEGTVLSYAEVKALAVGNPLIKTRVEVANALTRYLLLQRRATEAHIRLEQEATELPGRIAHQSAVVKACRADAAFVQEGGEIMGAEEKKILREELALALRENILTHEERELFTYRGFRVVLPANMDVRAPFIWLCREGRYHVEMSTAEMGLLIRLDGFIDNLNAHYKKLRDALATLKHRKVGIAEELARDDGYSEHIEMLMERLAKIDKELGVKDA